MTRVAVKYEAPPTVSEFMDSNAFVRVIVGPVGSGKSSGCIMEILRRAMEQAPGPDGIRRTRFAVIRNTYRELEDTTRKTFEQWIPDALGKWHEQAFTFEMRFRDVHCEVLFRALDRPEDIKKLLSLELTGAYINELREVPKPVFDVLQSRVGRYPSRIQGGPSWFGVWGDTNPWHDGHWGQELFSQTLEGHELYRQPGGRAPDAENTENLPAGYYSRLVIGKDTEWIKVYVDGEDASGAVGAVFGDLLTKLAERGGITAFDHPKDGMFTSWDLGVSDSTAIWFWRIREGQVDLVDHYEAHGFPMSHYFAEVEARNFTYVKHFLPHDARARTFQTGISVQDQFNTHFGADKVAITPQLSIADGIAAARWLLEQPTRFHTRCDEGIKNLRAYRYDWDETRQVFSKNPVHDFASHTADAFRYVALAYKFSEVLTRPPAKAEPLVIDINARPSWNDVMAARKQRVRGRV